MRIGDYTISSVYAGSLWLDGGAIFGVVPKVLWEKLYEPDARNRIKCITRCLLVRGNGKTILIDTGCGNKWSEKEKNIYSFEYTLLDNLEGIGIQPQDVTDVILTHLHFDHTGGATENKDGKIVPTFPRATYYVQRKQWEWACHPSEKDRASFRQQDFVPLMEYRQLTLLDDEMEIIKNISVVLTMGHTFGQQLVKISDGSTTLLHCADFLPYVAQLSLPYIMAYDLLPLETLKEKKSILQKAADEQWNLFIEHDPTVEAMTIQRTEKGFTPSRKFSL